MQKNTRNLSFGFSKIQANTFPSYIFFLFLLEIGILIMLTAQLKNFFITVQSYNQLLRYKLQILKPTLLST